MKAKDVISFKANVNGPPTYDGKHGNFEIPINTMDLSSLKKGGRKKSLEELAVRIGGITSVIFRANCYGANSVLPIFRGDNITVYLGEVSNALEALSQATVKGTSTYMGVHVQRIDLLGSNGEVDAIYQI